MKNAKRIVKKMDYELFTTQVLNLHEMLAIRGGDKVSESDSGDDGLN